MKNTTIRIVIVVLSCKRTHCHPSDAARRPERIQSVCTGQEQSENYIIIIADMQSRMVYWARKLLVRIDIFVTAAEAAAAAESIDSRDRYAIGCYARCPCAQCGAS